MKNNLPKQARPRKFKDVVGQELSVKLLHNGLKQNLLGNACLLHGPAGVGKTTLARLIAQWICCEKHENEEPCGHCKGCSDCINGSHPDVFELDGASNTSVESIRTLLDGTIYKPVIANKRIYIIDEVHMLSKSAISALLKTLEEPNDYIQFILATTDIEKIPKTIISRCFRVTLDSIKKEDMLLHLQNISKNHNFQADSKALEMIVFAAYGSMRQALSILEQAALLFDKQISKENIHKMLGLASEDVIQNLIKDILANNIEQLRISIEKIINQGVDVLSLVRQMLNYIRKSCSLDEQYITLGYMLAQSSVELHQSPYPEEIIDLHLIKAATINASNPFKSTQSDIKPLEQDISESENLRKKAYELFKQT